MVPALVRGLQVLQSFSRDTRTLTAPELAERLELPRATVFRLLTTLETLGFLERSDRSHEYRLGLGVLRLGFEYLAALPLAQLGNPVLERLSLESNFPCSLVVRDGRSIVYVARVVPPQPFVSAVSVGTRLPAHATVLGRILLEDVSLAELRAIYPENELKRYSPSTPATVADLYALVQEDRERGYAISQGFYEAHISTVATPVRDHGARVVAAVGLTINAGQIAADRVEELADLARGAARELSAMLGYSGKAGVHPLNETSGREAS